MLIVGADHIRSLLERDRALRNIAGFLRNRPAIVAHGVPGVPVWRIPDIARDGTVSGGRVPAGTGFGDRIAVGLIIGRHANRPVHGSCRIDPTLSTGRAAADEMGFLIERQPVDILDLIRQHDTILPGGTDHVERQHPVFRKEPALLNDQVSNLIRGRVQHETGDPANLFIVWRVDFCTFSELHLQHFSLLFLSIDRQPWSPENKTAGTSYACRHPFRILERLCV